MNPLIYNDFYGFGNWSVTLMNGSNVIDILLQSGQRIYDRYCPANNYETNESFLFL